MEFTGQTLNTPWANTVISACWRSHPTEGWLFGIVACMPEGTELFNTGSNCLWRADCITAVLT